MRDRAPQPFPLADDPLSLGVVLDKGLDELLGVFPHDLADRRPFRRGPFEQVGEVLEHLCPAGAVSPPENKEIALDRVNSRAIRLWEHLDACRIPAPTSLVADQPRDEHGPRLPPLSCSRRSARKLHVRQNSSRYCCPLALSEYTLRGGPFSEGTLSTSTRPCCSTRMSSA